MQSVYEVCTEKCSDELFKIEYPEAIENAISMDARKFYFTDTFVLFFKEKYKEKPYFYLLVN